MGALGPCLSLSPLVGRIPCLDESSGWCSWASTTALLLSVRYVVSSRENDQKANWSLLDDRSMKHHLCSSCLHFQCLGIFSFRRYARETTTSLRNLRRSFWRALPFPQTWLDLWEAWVVVLAAVLNLLLVVVVPEHSAARLVVSADPC